MQERKIVLQPVVVIVLQILNIYPLQTILGIQGIYRYGQLFAFISLPDHVSGLHHVDCHLKSLLRDYHYALDLPPWAILAEVAG